jgi:hypothetical protein
VRPVACGNALYAIDFLLVPNLDWCFFPQLPGAEKRSEDGSIFSRLLSADFADERRFDFGRKEAQKAQNFDTNFTNLHESKTTEGNQGNKDKQNSVYFVGFC